MPDEIKVTQKLGEKVVHAVECICAFLICFISELLIFFRFRDSGTFRVGSNFYANLFRGPRQKVNQDTPIPLESMVILSETLRFLIG